MNWHEVLGLTGVCSQEQVEEAFIKQAKPYKDQEWSSMHFEEKQRVQELLDAFEVLGAGKSAQLLYQQFLCSKTIHGYAPVDPANAYVSTFDSSDPEHTTVMPVPTTEKNVKEMIRLANLFHAYRMLGHALSRTAPIETIERHYQQFQTDITKLSLSAAERSKVQKLEGLPPSTDQAFWEARLRHAKQAFKLLSEHREQYDQILERGVLSVVLTGWTSPWSDRLRVMASVETLSVLVLKTDHRTRMQWKPFPVAAVKLRAVFKMPAVPESLKAMEDDEQADGGAAVAPPAPAVAETKRKRGGATQAQPKKKKKKAKKPGPAASQSSEARALAKERAKMKAMRGGAKASNKAVVASTKQPQPKKKKKKKAPPPRDTNSDLMELMARLNGKMSS